ncbi:SseB family protein [Nocardioides aequoreus]|uniref:SseB family protein n=1 Tax=Nocardioides aequoreus TaxID=397278 RepID=UPI0004C38B02|nr:SseB family protein [Nocardioides aequoreus]
MRSIPDPGFSGDDGRPDAAVVAALSAYDVDPRDRGRGLAVLAALQDSRVLVPVVAVAGETETNAAGLTQEKTTDMAAVLLRGRGGRQALLAFSGLERLHAWDPQARPVPVSLPDAARSAQQNSADALVLDVAGPVTFVLEAEQLRPLAEGMRLLRLADGGWGWATG